MGPRKEGGGTHDLSQATRGQWENIWDVVRRIDLRTDGVLQNPEEVEDQEPAGFTNQLVNHSPRSDRLDRNMVPHDGAPEYLAMVPYDGAPQYLALSKPMRCFSFSDFPEPNIEDTPGRSSIKKRSSSSAEQEAKPEEAPPADADAVLSQPSSPEGTPIRAPVPSAKSVAPEGLGLSPADQVALAAAQKAPVLAHGHNAIKSEAAKAILRLQEESKEAAVTRASKKANLKILTHTIFQEQPTSCIT